MTACILWRTAKLRKRPTYSHRERSYESWTKIQCSMTLAWNLWKGSQRSMQDISSNKFQAHKSCHCASSNNLALRPRLTPTCDFWICEELSSEQSLQDSRNNQNSRKLQGFRDNWNMKIGTDSNLNPGNLNTNTRLGLRLMWTVFRRSGSTWRSAKAICNSSKPFSLQYSSKLRWIIQLTPFLHCLRLFFGNAKAKTASQEPGCIEGCAHFTTWFYVCFLYIPNNPWATWNAHHKAKMRMLSSVAPRISSCDAQTPFKT